MRQPVPFGKYLLLDRISVGGMAEVFKAKSYGVEGFEKIIAIKRILPTMGEDRDFIKMFIDEAKIAGQLAHANICQIFELGRIDGSHFIAMEYIWGKDLLQMQNRMRKMKQQMPIAMACFIIAKVLEGLDYAHRKRDPLGRPLEIVHRDCSPQNVLISYEGEVKVIDFGIAKATSRNSRTMAGVLKGKFGYMSPEQVRGLPLDRRSDLFALGTMLFECLTGERLFQGETDFSTLEKVRNVDIRRPTEINPNIPDAVERIIMKALAKDVDNRYQWCSEMLADLQQFLMGQDVVFTAKQLSSWLKEGFAAEIEKERGLLEQYKRVGRDGLIAGLPAAEAKLDVVEHLGEAPQIPESDATQLGGPSFDDIEKELAAIASPDGVGPASGSPAARGSARAKSAADDGDGDFGEEAPTEIFGEIEHGKSPSDQPGAQAAPTSRPGTPPPNNKPPKPAPSRAPTAIPSITGRPQTSSSPMGAQAQQVEPQQPPQQPPPSANSNGGFGVFGSEYQPPPLGTGTPGPQIQIGNNPPQAINALAQPGQNQARTLMGAMAPPGVPNYGGNFPRPTPPGGPPPLQFDPQTGYPLNPSGQQPAQQGYPQNQYAQPQYDSNQQAAMPQGGSSGQYPSHNPYAQSTPNPYGYSNQTGPQQFPSDQGYQSPYPTNTGYPPQTYSQAGGSPAAAVEKQVEGRKRSSLGRDIAIGVVIAVVVLGGFLAVKFLVLDSGGGEEVADKGGSAATSGIATLRISLPGDITAQLFIDDKSIGTFGDKAEVLTNVGTRKIKLVRDDSKCEREVKLEPNKPNVFDCVITLKAAGSGSAAPTSGSGSAAIAPAGGSGSATIPATATGSGGGGGSSAVVATVGGGSGSAATKKEPAVIKTPDKTPDKKPDVKVVDNTKKPDKMPAEVEKKPPTDKGYLEIYSTPKAKILVDGIDTGLSTPIAGNKLSLSPGKHKITFLVGEDRFTFPATVKAGGTETLRKEFNQ